MKSLRNPQLHNAHLLADKYRGRRVMVLGADGFLGVHLAMALQAVGAQVRLLSRRAHPVLSDRGFDIIFGDLTDKRVLQRAFLGQEILFDVAGSSGAVDSMLDPQHNLTAECAPHLLAFQVAAEQPVPPLMVFCSSRTVYGVATDLPVDESARIEPVSVYGIHKATLERYLQLFQRAHGMPYLIFRLANPYGPHPWSSARGYGVINQFIRLAHEGAPIPVYGDGSQLRDYIFIDDMVEAFLLGAVTESCQNEIFNLGGPAGISVMAAAELLCAQGTGSVVQQMPWPTHYKTVETGDYVTDLGKLRAHLGAGVVQTSFAEGVKKTLEWYRQRAAASRIQVTSPDSSPEVSSPAGKRWQGRRVCVTGASGFIGRQLCAQLLHEGAEVMAIHRKHLPEPVRGHNRCFALEAELADPDGLWFERVRDYQPDSLFHLASEPDGPETKEAVRRRVDSNVRATTSLLSACHGFDLKAIVYADSCKVFGNGPCPHREHSPLAPEGSYSVSKLAAWEFILSQYRLQGTPVVALRSTMVYGPGQGMNLFTYLASRHLAGAEEIPIDGGPQTRDPLFIDDVVEAFLLLGLSAARLSGRAIPVGGGTELSVEKLAQIFLETAGSQARLKLCPERLRSTEMMRSYCDNIDADKLLGWKSRVALEDGLRATLDYLQAPEGQTAHLSRWLESIVLGGAQTNPQPVGRCHE